MEVGLPSVSLMRSHQSEETASPYQQHNGAMWASDLIQDAIKKRSNAKGYSDDPAYEFKHLQPILYISEKK